MRADGALDNGREAANGVVDPAGSAILGDIGALDIVVVCGGRFVKVEKIVLVCPSVAPS